MVPIHTYMYICSPKSQNSSLLLDFLGNQTENKKQKHKNTYKYTTIYFLARESEGERVPVEEGVVSQIWGA